MRLSNRDLRIEGFIREDISKLWQYSALFRIQHRAQASLHLFCTLKSNKQSPPHIIFVELVYFLQSWQIIEILCRSCMKSLRAILLVIIFEITTQISKYVWLKYWRNFHLIIFQVPFIRAGNKFHIWKVVLMRDVCLNFILTAPEMSSLSHVFVATANAFFRKR